MRPPSVRGVAGWDCVRWSRPGRAGEARFRVLLFRFSVFGFKETSNECGLEQVWRMVGLNTRIQSSYSVWCVVFRRTVSYSTGVRTVVWYVRLQSRTAKYSLDKRRNVFQDRFPLLIVSVFSYLRPL